MKILRSHRTAMGRQIAESVAIETSQADYILNSKAEWNGATVPRLTLEVGGNTRQEEYRGKTQGRREIPRKEPNISSKRKWTRSITTTSQPSLDPPNQSRGPSAKWTK